MQIYKLHSNLRIKHEFLNSRHSRPPQADSPDSHRIKGFSLIETLIAIVILVSAIVGPLTLAQRSIRSAVYARDQITASFLAEEGVEFIRMYRDGNKLGNKNWLNGFSDCFVTSDRICYVDATRSDNTRNYIQQCNERNGLYGSVCPVISFKSDNGWYGYPQRGESGWTDTRFVREIAITTIPRGNNTNDKEAKVEVTVKWKTGDLPNRSVVVRDYIYDW